jgi:hypothetical protein
MGGSPEIEVKLTRVAALLVLTIGVLSAMLATQAQPQGKIPWIGYLSLYSGPSNSLEAFRQSPRPHDSPVRAHPSG